MVDKNKLHICCSERMSEKMSGKPRECRPLVSGCMSAAGTGKLQFIEGTMNAYMYCDILKQSVIPSLRRLGCRAVFQNYNDHCPAKEAEAKGNGLAKHLSRPKPY